MENAPEMDEFVLVTVRKILPYGAFCSLDEYKGREAFVHISEVAPRWIKNIHEFLHEGQRTVAKVYQIIPEKNQIDLSFKRVTESEKKRKMESIRREKRADKLFELSLKEAKSTAAEAKAIREKLEGKFGDLYGAYEALSAEGEAAVHGLKLEKGFVSAALEVAKKSIKKARVEVRGILQLASYAADGVEIVKSTLAAVKPPAGMELRLTYLGAPRYQIDVVAEDFKSAEKALADIVEQVEKGMRGKPSFVSFEKIKKQA